MSVQVSYKKQTIFFIILIFIFLSAIEITIRIYDFYNPNCNFVNSDVFAEVDDELKLQICRDNIALKWDRNPLSLIPNQNLNTISVNSEGFRGNELSLNPDYRIFIIGGSTTFGVGSTSDSKTIPYSLQEKFTQVFPNQNIEVINAGIPQAYSFTESTWIKEKILSYSPDLLIIYDGWNDLDQDYEFYFEGTDPSFLDRLIRYIGKSDYITPKIILTYYVNLKNNSIEIVEFNSNKIDEKVSLWQNTWKDICQLEKENNFKTIITLQPLVGTGQKNLTSEEFHSFKKFDGESTIFYYDFYQSALNELNSECFSTLDLRNAFDSNSETIFYDFGHVGDFGNKIIAEKIYEKILPTVLEDLSK